MLAGVALAVQLSVGRQVGCGADTSTNFPFACGSHRTNSVLSAKRGRTTVVAVTFFDLVPGLHASMVPSRVRTRGDRRSMCEWPRRQPRHVPTCSFFPSAPHCLYSDTSQSLAAFWRAVPDRRGPSESSSTCPSRCTCELSMPRRQKRSSAALGAGKVAGVWAPRGVRGTEATRAATSAVTAARGAKVEVGMFMG